MTTMAPAAAAPYPIRLDIQYAESLSRLTFVKWILAIPHYLIIYALNIVFEIISLIAFFAILFTGAYPRSLFDFAVNTQRWRMNLVGYVMLIRDEYPPFSFEAGLYPVTFEVDYPTNLKRFAPLYKWILAIPHFIIVSRPRHRRVRPGDHRGLRRAVHAASTPKACTSSSSASSVGRCARHCTRSS